MNNSIVSFLKGKTKEEAKNLIKESGCICRIIEIDDNPIMGTNDYRTDRINLKIKNNKVVEASIG